MKFTTTVLTAVGIIFHCFTSAGQTPNKFIVRTFDFKDSINSKIIHPNTDNVCVILIDGYLKGKLSGYQSAVVDEVVKRGPVSQEGLNSWKADEDYYVGDKVLFETYVYELYRELPGRTKNPSENSDFWVRTVGEPLSVRHHFPTIRDTLSKPDFLKKLVMQAPEKFYQWDPKIHYYEMDVVWYEGKNYEVIAEEVEGKLPTDVNFYRLSNRGRLELFPINEVNAIRVLYSLDANGKLQPQTISLLLKDYSTELFREVATFLFEDVINYLNTTNNALLYTTDTGYLGVPEMIFDYSERLAVLQLLKTKLKTGEIKPNKSFILDQDKYHEFLSDTTNLVETFQWEVMQSLFNELILGELRINSKSEDGLDSYTIPFLKLPIRSISKYLGKGPVQINTYQQILMTGGLNFHETSFYDTLSVRSNSIRLTASTKKGSFYEIYWAKTDSANLNFTAEVVEVWKSIERAFANQKIKPQHSLVTFYPCTYSTGTNTVLTVDGSEYTFNKKFNLGVETGASNDTLPTTKEFGDISVIYKRSLSTPNIKVSQFEPVEVTFHFLENKPGYSPLRSNFTFIWKELKSILLTQASLKIKGFVESIEKGSVNFYNSQLAYGLIEE